MKKTTAALITLVAIGTSTTFAATPASSGIYLEGNIGQSASHISDDGLDFVNIDQTGLGGNINLGYKFNRYFAAEIGFTKYADSKATGSASGGGISESVNATIEQYAFDAAAKGILPINDTGIELFGKLGVARITQSGNATAFATSGFSSASVSTSKSQNVVSPYFGIGAQYSFTTNIVGNVQAARARGNSDTGSLDLISLGVSYIFG